jgi:3-hydroxyisobutyrate dehydrogenase
LQRAVPVLKTLGSTIRHAGPVGCGAFAKLATNTLMGVQSMPTVSAVRSIFRRAIDENLGNLNMTAVARLFSKER